MRLLLVLCATLIGLVPAAHAWQPSLAAPTMLSTNAVILLSSPPTRQAPDFKTSCAWQHSDCLHMFGMTFDAAQVAHNAPLSIKQEPAAICEAAMWTCLDEPARTLTEDDLAKLMEANALYTKQLNAEKQKIYTRVLDAASKAEHAKKVQLEAARRWQEQDKARANKDAAYAEQIDKISEKWKDIKLLRPN